MQRVQRATTNRALFATRLCLLLLVSTKRQSPSNNFSSHLGSYVCRSNGYIRKLDMRSLVSSRVVSKERVASSQADPTESDLWGYIQGEAVKGMTLVMLAAASGGATRSRRGSKVGRYPCREALGQPIS